MNNAPTRSGVTTKPTLPSTGDVNVVWEWESLDEMQMRLAGHQPREEYLRDRVDRADWVVRTLRLTPESEVFEIGSGEGIMANEVASQVGRFLCTDVSRSFLEKAAHTCRAHDNVETHHIENDYLAALPSTAFDAGFSLNVFIHLNPFEVYLYFVQIARILRPGGQFVVNFLDIGDATRDFFHFFADRYQHASHLESKGFLTWYDVNLVAKVAVEAGLSPLLDEFVDEDGVCFLVLRRPEEPAA